MRSIHGKLFSLISGVVVVVVAAVSVVHCVAQRRALEDGLLAEAAAFARMVGEQTRSALSYDDVSTVREAFAAAALDEDVAFLALYRPDGSALYAQGEGAAPIPTPGASGITERRGDRARAQLVVTSPEGHDGTLVVELSAARIAAQGAAVRGRAALIAAAGLVAGCGAAWLIARGLSRRIERLTAGARRAAAGDLATPALVDGSADEIGQLAAAIDAMVGNLRGLVQEIDEAAGMIDSSTHLFLDASRDLRGPGAAPLESTVVSSVVELGAYATQLRGAVEHFRVRPPAAPRTTAASSAEHAVVEHARS